jgi:hypothetical protein
MKQKILSVSVLFLIIFAGFGGLIPIVVAEQVQGDFDASMGRTGTQRPQIILDGSYKSRGRYLIVSGIASIRDTNSRFSGFFLQNIFFIRTNLIGQPIAFFGRCRFDSTHSTFTGIWISRGMASRGWITGEFIQTT